MSFVIPRTLSFLYTGWLFQSFTVHNESTELITTVVALEDFVHRHFLLKQQTLALNDNSFRNLKELCRQF